MTTLTVSSQHSVAAVKPLPLFAQGEHLALLDNLLVDNKKLYESYVEYNSRPEVQAFLAKKAEFKANREKAKLTKVPFESDFKISDAPPLPETVAIAIYKISHNYARKKNWLYLPFVDEMIGDAIIYCLKYCHNFDPKLSKNPYAYITSTVHNAFLQRIHTEKHQKEIKQEMWLRAASGQVASSSGSGPQGSVVTEAVNAAMDGIAETMTLDRDHSVPKTKPIKKKKESSNPVDEALGI